MRERLVTASLSAVLSVAAATSASAQVADTILVNGKILTVDAQFSTQSALAVREGKIVAVGRDDEIRKLAGPPTRTIDLQGRTVIPGLIDSHMHATRAALSFSTEVNWIGARSLREALERIGAGLPAGRMGEPEEVAETIAFLCSEGASWVHGAVLSIDGGSVRLVV